MRRIIEFIYWVKIFLAPVFAALIIIAIISSLSSGFNQWLLLLFLPAIVFGVLLAERARRKYGSSNFYAKPSNTPDIPNSDTE